MEMGNSGMRCKEQHDQSSRSPPFTIDCNERILKLPWTGSVMFLDSIGGFDERYDEGRDELRCVDPPPPPPITDSGNFLLCQV